MRRFCCLLAAAVFALFSGACEKHPASELADAHGGHGSAKHEPAHPPGPGKHATDAAHPEAKPAEQTGEPAKFFPQSK